MKELKPCPFCGGEARIFVDPERSVMIAKCSICSASINMDFTNPIELGYSGVEKYKFAVEYCVNQVIYNLKAAWNRRAADE